MAIASNQWKTQIIQRLGTICDDKGNITHRTAQDLIRGSAWWETHSSGPVPAPKHADRIERRDGSWSIKFGANSFLISKATHRCCNRIKKWASKQNGNISAGSWATLYKSLAKAIRGSVANFKGEEYPTYEAGHGNTMEFGTQSIHIDGFIRTIGRLIKVEELHTFQRTAKNAPFPNATGIAGSKANPALSCPWCNAAIHPSKLENHLRNHCPQRHAHPVSTDSAIKLAASLARPVSSGHAQGAKALHRSPASTGKKQDACQCPWCGISVSTKRLAKHKAERCPKRPNRPTS